LVTINKSNRKFHDQNRTKIKATFDTILGDFIFDENA